MPLSAGFSHACSCCFCCCFSVYFEDWFDVSSTVAGNFNSIPYGLAAIMSPIFGFTVDRVGRSVSWRTFSCCVRASSMTDSLAD